MNSDDFIYLFFLFSSIAFGHYYRKIENADFKKKTGAIVGFLIILAVSRIHFIHTIITLLINSVIILYTNKRYCHIISFIFSFIYLIFFRTTVYFGIPYPPSHTNLVQMILTLKLVGLAFEVNSAYIHNTKKDDGKKDDENIAESEMCSYKLEIEDIFYYGLNYIAVLTGPFYKYKTYYDHLHKPFYKYDDYKTATLRRLFPLFPIFGIIYLFTDYMWPMSIFPVSGVSHEPKIRQEANKDLCKRFWGKTSLMRIYIGLILSECVCIMGGLGLYPTFAKSQPGHGPTTNFFKLKEICEKESDLRTVEYDYETIHSIHPYGTEFYPTLRDGMKNWNMTVQYWLATCVYKRFPSKKFRTFATMFVSGVWHGVYSGYYISVGMIPFGLIVEDIWADILLTDEFFLPKNVGCMIMLFLKMQFFSYAALAFSLLDVHKILHYYNLVYHWMVFFTIAMFFIGRYLRKVKKQARSKENLRNVDNVAETPNEPILEHKKAE